MCACVCGGNESNVNIMRDFSNICVRCSVCRSLCCSVCVAACVLQRVCCSVCVAACVCRGNESREDMVATISKLLKIMSLFCKRAL